MKVFRDLLLVELLGDEAKENSSGIILPDTKKVRFIKLKVLEVGPKVFEDITVDDIVYAENMVEKIDVKDPHIGLILSQYVMYRINRPME